MPGIPGADRRGKIPGNGTDIHISVTAASLQLPEHAEQHGDPHGDPCPAAGLPDLLSPEIGHQVSGQGLKAPVRIVPGFRQDDAVSQGLQPHGIAAHAEIHIPGRQPGPEQQVQDLRHAAVEGQRQQAVHILRRKHRRPEGQVQPSVRSPVLPQGPLGCKGVTTISRSYIQHVPSLQWRCSRKCP